MWIDSHSHLNHPKIAELGSLTKIIERAETANIDGILTICCRIHEELNQLITISEKHPNIWCSIGTHPHDAGIEEEKNITEEELVSLARSNSNIIGIGESGLDYFYNNSSPEDQQSSFRKHIKACLETKLPLIVHSRDAEEDTIRIIREEGGQKAGLTGVMHCFSSGWYLAEQALEEGFYISFSGIVTFKKSKELQDIAKKIPLNRLLIETDAPFLAPEPYRGKINEPALVAHTGAFLADLHKISKEDLANHCKENFFNLFKKAYPL